MLDSDANQEEQHDLVLCKRQYLLCAAHIWRNYEWLSSLLGGLNGSTGKDASNRAQLREDDIVLNKDVML